jgi:hypothetical protein
MAKSIRGQLSMFGPEICEGSGSAISSPELAAGAMPCASPDGLTIDLSGPAHAPVSLSQAQARAEGRRTRVTFGRSSAVSFANAGLQSSLESRLRQRLGGCGSPLFSLTRKHWPIAQQAPIYALRASGRRTSDSGSTSSWPTPVVNDVTGSQYAYASGNHDRPYLKLPGAAKLASWPTPCAQHANGEPEAFLERKRRAIARGSSMGVSLTDLQMVAKLATWATPTTRDHKDGSSDGTAPINALLGQQAWLASGPIATGSPAATEKPGQLNPAHSRWLMGYPPAWDDCAVTAMPSFRKSRRSS